MALRTEEELYGDDAASSEGEAAPEQSAGDGTSQAAAPQGPTPDASQQASDDDGDSDGEIEDLSGLKNALRASRDDTKAMKKRAQEAERRLEALEQQFRSSQQPQQPQQPQGPQYPDFYADPTAHIEQREAVLLEQMESKVWRNFANTSEKIAKRFYEDYDDAKGAFLEAYPQGQPHAQIAWSQVVTADDPAEFVYQEGKRLLAQHQGPQSASEVEALKARIAELESAQANPQRVVQQPARTIPKSNAGARGSSVSQRAWSGPRSAEQIYGE